MTTKIRTGLFTAATAAALATTLALPAASVAIPATTGAMSRAEAVPVAAKAAPVRQKSNIRAGQRNPVASHIPVPAGKTLKVEVNATDDDTAIDTCSAVCVELKAAGGYKAVFSAGNRPKTADITMRAVDPTGDWTTVTWTYVVV
ncbi:hypothetical protein [Streptomyces sp. GbtcB6]|uniref:hypothetical protein n=1 Tax=Streptomyces sp. GbtcB6 TaxID=2824751 RepID=UPI001C30940B|nr:hypothetical protein [Streptomyces sp. GbtcB6]